MSISKLHPPFLHSRCITIVQTPAHRNHSVNTHVVKYSFCNSLFGKVIVGSDSTGVCVCDYIENEKLGLEHLKKRYPHLTLQCDTSGLHRDVVCFLENPSGFKGNITVHIQGTSFQCAVWNALLDIPWGTTVTYGKLAQMANNQSAIRAVGTAIGKNPLSFILPCHRVIRSDGSTGEYLWGTALKKKMIDYERDHL